MSLQYLKEYMKDEVDLEINIKGFFKLILSFRVCVARHAQITQNNKLLIFLQYLKKEVIDEVDFLHADKYQSFLQLSIKVFYKVLLSLWMVMIKHSQSTQRNKFAISLQYLKKEVRNGVHFLHPDKY